MNIGLFTDTYFPQLNGVAASTATLATQLRALGHTVYIFTPSDPHMDDADPWVIHMPSMPCVFIQQYRVGLAYPPHVLAKIASFKLDIIHTQTEFSLGMFGKTFSKLGDIPMVHTYHTMYEDYVHYIVNGALISRSTAHRFSRMFCNFARHVIAPTEKVRQSLLEYGVTKPIHVIPTGIDVSRFLPERYSEVEVAKARAEFGLGKEHFVVLVLGRVTKEKSIDVVLDAMPALFAKHENARLLLVGDGQYRPELEAQAEALGIRDKVIFGGFRPWEKIGLYYQTGDVFVSASQSETQGLTIVEAMAAGLPVVARDDLCIRGVVEEGKTGLLFTKTEELSAHLEQLMAQKDLAKTLSENGKAKAASLSAETFGRHVEALYQTVISDWNKRYVKADYADWFEHILHKHHRLRRLAAYELMRLKHSRHRQRLALTPIAVRPKKWKEQKQEEEKQ